MLRPQKSSYIASYGDNFLEKMLSQSGFFFRPRRQRLKDGLNCWERISGGGGGGRGKNGWVARRLKKVFSWRLGKIWVADVRRAGQGRFGYDPLSYSLNFDETAGQDFSMRYATIPSTSIYIGTIVT